MSCSDSPSHISYMQSSSWVTLSGRLSFCFAVVRIWSTDYRMAPMYGGIARRSDCVLGNRRDLLFRSVPSSA